jgi:hypothetical protein
MRCFGLLIASLLLAGAAAAHEIRWAAGFGLGGQRLFVVPSHDIVVVTTAGLYKAPLNGQGGLAAEIFNDYVLAALREP